MLGIEIVSAFESSDKLVAAMRDIADRIEKFGQISDDLGEAWGLVGYEERPEDGPGMWALRCIHRTTLYVGQGVPEDDTSPEHQSAREQSRKCAAGLAGPRCAATDPHLYLTFKVTAEGKIGHPMDHILTRVNLTPSGEAEPASLDVLVSRIQREIKAKSRL